MSTTDGRSGLNAERITQAALELVDTEGLEALTMRRLARRLDAPVMTLYRHVRTKDEVLDRLAERSLEELELPRAAGTWDDQLKAIFAAVRTVFLRHPGLARLFADRAVSGPAAYRITDRVLMILRDAGLGPREAVDAFTALLTYTLGASLFTIARSPDAPSEAEKRRLERLYAASAEDLPAFVEAREHFLVRGTEQQFEYGLDHLLDGLRRELRH